MNPRRVAQIVYLLLTCCSISLSQGSDATRSKSTSAEAKRIKILYDKTIDNTTVSLPLMAVREVPGTIAARFPEGTRNLPSETLQMTAYFHCPGKILVAPDQVMFGFLALSQGEAKYRSDDQATATVAGTSLNLWTLKVADRRVESNIELKDVTFWRETLQLTVSAEEFLRIARGKNVTMRLGKTEFTLSASHLKFLRALADKIDPKIAH